LETAVENRLYEAMFLVDAAEAEADWDNIESNVRNILERVEADIVSLKKWDTRRLAYDIDKKSRGTYILCYFRGDGTRIGEIERTVQLSERIMRVLILCVDHIVQDDIEKDTPVMLAEKQEEGTAAEAAVEETGAETVSVEEGSKTEVGEVSASEQASEGSEPEQQAEAEMERDSASVERQDKEETDER
jgi:small subunit ribosomal protein S6